MKKIYLKIIFVFNSINFILCTENKFHLQHIKTGEIFNLNNLTLRFPLSETDGYCEKNYCYGVPKLRLNNNSQLICANRDLIEYDMVRGAESFIEYESAVRFLCSSFGYDDLLSYQFHYG